MVWFRVDDGFADHPKVIGCSLAAVGLWTKAGAWCSKHLTDGAVPGAMVRVFGGTPKLAAELVAAGLWDTTTTGFLFHDWKARNPLREDVESRRTSDAERKRLERESEKSPGGRPNGHNTDGASDSAPSPRARARVPVPSRPVPALPVPSDPLPDSEPDCVGLAPERRDEGRVPPSAIWTAYTVAYQRRYGLPPVRNAKINAQIKQLAARLPAEDAVATVTHYVGSQNARYVAAGHSVGCLLQDAEKLCTEALTGRQSTAHAAREADGRAGRWQEHAEVIARLEAEEKAQ